MTENGCESTLYVTYDCTEIKTANKFPVSVSLKSTTTNKYVLERHGQFETPSAERSFVWIFKMPRIRTDRWMDG